MRDELVFLNTSEGNGQLFVHAYLPQGQVKAGFLFLNPFFDEAKRSHTFFAHTARLLRDHGFAVFRFDYYGHGDSTGEMFESSPEKCIQDASVVFQSIQRQYPQVEVTVLGVRLGADLGLKFVESVAVVKKLILVEPLMRGDVFLTEQRLRRMLFHKLNNMSPDLKVRLNGLEHEDFQGYLLSQRAMEEIGSIESENLGLSGCSIEILKVNSINAKKNLPEKTSSLASSNDIRIHHVDCGEFWSSHEPVNVQPLTQTILSLSLC